MQLLKTKETNIINSLSLKANYFQNKKIIKTEFLNKN